MRERLRPVSLLVISGWFIDCAVLYYASSSSMYYRRGGLILGTTPGETVVTALEQSSPAWEETG